MKNERREENCKGVNNHQKKNVLAKIIGSELMNYKLKKLSVVLEKKKLYKLTCRLHLNPFALLQEDGSPIWTLKFS